MKYGIKILFIFLLVLIGLLPVFAVEPNILEPNKPDFGPYIKKLDAKVKSNWNPPSISDIEVVKFTAMLKIAKNGDLIDIKIKNSSGSNALDVSAIKAVKQAFPADPLPEGYDKEFIDILYTFVMKLEYRRVVLAPREKPVPPPPKEPDYINLIFNELTVSGKRHLIKDDLYVYLNTHEKNLFANTEFFAKYKIDCKNMTLGNIKQDVITFQKNIDNDNFTAKLINVERIDKPIKMYPVSKNSHYKLIYDYACTN